MIKRIHRQQTTALSQCNISMPKLSHATYKCVHLHHEGDSFSHRCVKTPDVSETDVGPYLFAIFGFLNINDKCFRDLSLNLGAFGRQLVLRDDSLYR